MTELDPEARRVLALAALARSPSERDKARVERRIALALGVAAAAAPALAAGQVAKGAGVAKTAAALFSLKWWISGGALLSAAVVGYATLAPTSVPERPAPRAVSAAPLHTAGPAPVAEAPVEVVEPESEVAPAAALPEVLPAPLPHATKHRHTRPDLARELDLLHEAQAAWRGGDARGAMTLLARHAQRFPRSALSVERDALSVLALCELGRGQEAERLAKKLLARAPKAPVRRAVEESCALR